MELLLQRDWLTATFVAIPKKVKQQIAKTTGQQC